MEIKTAVIPAAGLGTRFLPNTKSVPKELIPLINKPCIHNIVDEAIAAGIEKFVFVISKEKEGIKDYFQPNERLYSWLEKRGKGDMAASMKEWEQRAEFKFVYQEDPLGLGHAVLCAEQEIEEDHFFVILPDDIISANPPVCQQMVDTFKKDPTPMLSVMSVKWENVQSYGIVAAAPLSDNLGAVQDIVEKPKREDAPSNLAVIGRYILPKTIFSILGETKPGSGNEIQLTDALRELMKGVGLRAYSFTGERFDTGTPVGWIQANLSLAMQNEEMRTPLLKTIRYLNNTYS